MKQDISLPVRQEGESDVLFRKRIEAWVREFLYGGARSKADNREWTGSPPFHLDKPTS